jgi:hypothetical protein
MGLLLSPSQLISEKLSWPVGRGRVFHVVCGPRGISRWALEALCPLLETPRTLYWVDAANRFDAPALSKRAQALGMNPRTVLSHIQMARTFNAFQLVALLSGKLPRLSPGPVIIADPLAPFYDEDLPLEDARHAFSRLLLGLSDVPGPVLALVVDRSAPPSRSDFAPRFLKLAQSVTSVGPAALEN